jgi:glutaredoxin
MNIRGTLSHTMSYPHNLLLIAGLGIAFAATINASAQASQIQRNHAPVVIGQSVPENVGEPVTATSNPVAVSLAQHLQKMGAKMYGAYWCPHCHDQKQLFGKEAIQYIQYIECDPSGKAPQPALCKAKQVEGFPTWEINGKLYPGQMSLQELAKLSGYPGDRKF